MTMSKQEFLQSARLETRTLEVWIEQHWLLPEPTPTGPGFTERDSARARFIMDLKRTFGVNDEGIDVILHLVDQLHGMRYALTQLRKDMAQEKS